MQRFGLHRGRPDRLALLFDTLVRLPRSHSELP